jgi:hypothetical protein
VVQQIITKLVDDIDGKEIKQGGETVRFAVDGVSYEIDLNDRNAKKLRQSLATYVEHGRRVGGRRSGATPASKPKPKSKSNKADLAAIRQWARDNGYDVSDRGRVSREVQEAYARAR